MKALAAFVLLFAGAASAKESATELIVQPHCGPDGYPTGVTIGDKLIDLSTGDMADRLKPAVGERAQARQFTARIVGDTDLPYRCIGGIIFELQRAGVRKVHFESSEPAPQ